MTLVDEHPLGQILGIAPERFARAAAFVCATGRRPVAGTTAHRLLLVDLDPVDAPRCSLDRAHHVVEVPSG